MTDKPTHRPMSRADWDATNEHARAVLHPESTSGDAGSDLHEQIIPVEELSVHSWSPGKVADDVPCTQVHMLIRIQGKREPLVMRLKSRAAVDDLIAALIEHRDFVWPEPK